MATGLKELIVTFQANAQPVLRALNQVDARIKQTTRTLQSTGESFSRLGREMGLYLSLPIAAVGGASLKAKADIQSLEASLTSVLKKFDTGLPIQEAISNEMQFLQETANELGVALSAVQRPYVQYLASSNDNLEVTRATIKSFLGLSTALGLTAPQTELVVKALQQMQSKGRVTSEELRQQLGDNVPGAVKLFATAIGKTVPEFQKMMEAGEVSSDVISKVAETIEGQYGDAIKKGAMGIRANANRISNAFYMLRVNVGDGIDEVFSVNEKMANFAAWLNKVAANFKRLDDEGKKVIIITGAFIAVIGPLLIALGAVVRILGFAVLGFNLLIKPILLLLGFIPRLIAGLRILFLVMRANPLGIFITATVSIITYWKEIVDLFEQAYNWLSKLSISGAFDKIKDFAGKVVFGDNKIVGSSGLVSPNSPTTNQTKTTNNNLIVNVPAGASAADSSSIKNAVRQAIQEENRQSYIELGVQ